MPPINSAAEARIVAFFLLAVFVVAVVVVIRIVRDRHAIARAAREAALNTSAAGLKAYRKAKTQAEKTADEIKRRADT